MCRQEIEHATPCLGCLLRTVTRAVSGEEAVPGSVVTPEFIRFSFALERRFGLVHLLDGRVPHSIIGELFTDNGVGSWIRA